MALSRTSTAYRSNPAIFVCSICLGRVCGTTCVPPRRTAAASSSYSTRRKGNCSNEQSSRMSGVYTGSGLSRSASPTKRARSGTGGPVDDHRLERRSSSGSNGSNPHNSDQSSNSSIFDSAIADMQCRCKKKVGRSRSRSMPSPQKDTCGFDNDWKQYPCRSDEYDEEEACGRKIGATMVRFGKRLEGGLQRSKNPQPVKVQR